MKYSIKNRIQTTLFRLKRWIVLFYRRFATQKMMAVHDSDLDALLKKLGLLDGVKSEIYKCANCGCTITRENLGIITNENNATVIYCLSTSCGNIKEEND